MRRYILWSVIALLTCVIGVTGVLVWLFRGSPSVKTQEPTCRSCVVAYAAKEEGLPIVDVPEIVYHSEKYQKQIIRVRGFLRNDDGYNSLYDPCCDNEDTWTRADFSQFYISCPAAQKTVDQFLHSGMKKSARVIMVGRFEILPERARVSGCPFRFVIMCVENLEPLSSS